MVESDAISTQQPRIAGWLKRRYTVVAVILLAVLLFSYPHFAPNMRSYLFYLSFWVVMTSAFNIIYGFTGYLPFGYVAFYGVGSYVTAICTTKFGFYVPVAIFLSGGVGLLLGVLFAPTLRLKGIYFAIVNLALAQSTMIIIANLPEEWTGGSMGISMSAVYDPLMAYYSMVVLLLVTLLVTRWVALSRLGIALRCIREDPESAEVLGVAVVRSRLKAWLIAAVIPAWAGGIDAWHTGIVDPETAFQSLITVKTVVYAMFGGLGTLAGPAVGSVALYALDDLIWGNFPNLNMLLLGLLVIVLMLFFPRGVVGTLLRKFPRVRLFLK